MASIDFNKLGCVAQLNSCKCGICQEMLSEPKILPCAHSFCKSCLNLEKETGDQFACPSCGYLFDKPLNGIEGLECNLFVETFFSMLDSKEPVGFCDRCEKEGACEVPASVTCMDCSMNMCSSCHKIHGTFPLFSKHRVVDVKNSKSNVQESEFGNRNVCVRHPNRESEIFCTTCQNRLCLECGLNESSSFSSVGKNHVCIEISGIVKTDANKLKVNLDEIEGELLKHNENIKSVKAKLVTLERDHDVVKQTILEAKERIQKELEENTEKQLNEAAECFAQKQSSLMESLEKLESHVNHQSAVRDKWLCAQEFYPPVELHEASAKRMDLIEETAPKVNLSYLPVTYEVSRNALTEHSLKRFMGNLVEHVLFKGKAVNDTVHSSFTNRFYVSGIKSGLWVGDDEKLRKIHDVTSYGLCTSNDGLLLYSAAGRSGVIVFRLSLTQDPTLLRTIDVENGPDIQSICLSSTRRKVVVDSSGKKLFVFNEEDEVQQVIETTQFCEGKPRYTAWTGESQVCVSFKKSLSSPPCVMSIDTVRTCSLWKAEFPEGVGCVSAVGDLVYVSHSPRTAVVTVLTKEGVKIGTISRPGGKLVKVLGDANNTRKVTAVSVTGVDFVRTSVDEGLLRIVPRSDNPNLSYSEKNCIA